MLGLAAASAASLAAITFLFGYWPGPAGRRERLRALRGRRRAKRAAAGAAYVAHRIGARAASGYLARVHGPASAAACDAWRREILGGVARRGVVYVVDPRFRTDLARIPGVTCGMLDGLVACVLARPGDPLAEVLARRADAPADRGAAGLR